MLTDTAGIMSSFYIARGLQLCQKFPRNEKQKWNKCKNILVSWDVRRRSADGPMSVCSPGTKLGPKRRQASMKH